MSAALKVPKNTVATIILKWKMFGTTKTLPRAGRPAKLSNRGRRVLLRGNQEPDGHSDRAPLWRWENLPEGQPISTALHQSGLYGRVARLKPLLSKKRNSLFGVCQKAPKDSQTMRNKILWSDETRIEVFGLNAKCHVWRKQRDP